jgi:sec-independent protein translocase protein TatB
MMFDIGWSELLVIGVVALVVIGPKDLPKALKMVGFWVRKARQVSGEFRASIDQMVREAELEEVRQQVKKATELDIEKEFKDTVDPTGSLAEAIKPPELPDLNAPAAPTKQAEPTPPTEPPPAIPAPESSDAPHTGAAEPSPNRAASG